MQISDEDYGRFKEFYSKLGTEEPVFFMFFTSNLLHYALESIALVPKGVTLAIVTAGLTKEEIDCVHQYFQRPHINFEKKYHDTCIWEMLHRTATNHFGWLDVDCFVYNQNLFFEMAEMKSKDAMNAAWARPYDYYGVDGLFANTYFLFMNSAILQQMTKKYQELSLVPRVFERLKETPIYGNYKYLSKEEDIYLREKYPKTINNPKGYDTLHHYQILLREEGIPVNRVRELNQLGTYYSKELLHLGGCYRIHEALLDKGLRKVYFRFNMRYSYFLLNKYMNQLPAQYQEFQKKFAENLERNKLSTNLDEISESIRLYAERNGINISQLGVNVYDGL